MAKTRKDLPDECWELILSKLPHSLLESPSLSCKRFLSITNTLRTHLRIIHPSAFPISTLLNRFPNLDSISLRFCNGDLGRVIVDIANCNLNLKTLDFTGTDGLTVNSWKLLGSRMKNIRVLSCLGLRGLRDIELVAIADSMPCLEELDISYPVNGFGSDSDEPDAGSLGEVGVTDSGIEVLSSKLRYLRKIYLTGNKFLTDKSLIALSTNCVYLTDILVMRCPLVTEYGIGFVMLNSTNLSVLSVKGIDFGLLDDNSIRCARNISRLAIYDSAVPDEYLHLLVKACAPLKRFALYHCMRSCLTFSGISLLLNKYRSLESLCLNGIDFLTDEKMSDLSQCLSTLVVVRLDNCDNLTESTFFKLAKDCPLLEHISMEGTNLGGGGDMAMDIVKNSRINFLNLENNSNLSDECLAKLASVCPCLEELVVSSCKGITEKGIADFFKSGSKVRNLQIDECGGIMNIGNGFELSELECLGATRSGIDDDGLVVIGNRCRGLLDLNLDGCLGVTIVGLKEILKNCKSLRNINLTGCLNVSAEMVDWMVFSRPSLREIIVSHSSLSSENQRELILRHGCCVLLE